MKKGLIFIGPARSGKSRAALEIARVFGKKAVVLDRNVFNCSFPFQDVSRDTELLIIDDLRETSDIYYRFLADELIIDRLGEWSFKIKPLLIITCDASIIKSDLYKPRVIARHFDIIEFPIKVKAETLLTSIISL